MPYLLVRTFKYSIHPARDIINAGLPLALATDYNPGSTPSGNMNFVVATACIKMKMTPEEAINAATINGAYAMNLSNEVEVLPREKGEFNPNKRNSFVRILPYSFGSNLIDAVFINGKRFKLHTVIPSNNV